jgi:hypothetical protein
MKPCLRITAAVASVVCIACASAPAGSKQAPANGPGSERELPIPADLAPHIQESIELGLQLYFLDNASAVGTDVVVANVPNLRERGVGGWLTLRSADESGQPTPSFSVLFITAEEPRSIQFRVEVPLGGKPTFKEISPPTPLDDLGIRLFRARQTAIRSVPRGPRKWNPVILPGGVVGRHDAILVYLLAAEERAGEMVFGVHYRVLVSADGSTVQQAVPLSKSALVIPPPQESIPPGAERVATMVSQIVTDWPLETHVFVSLLHKRAPIYVVTRRGVWRVVGEKIALIDDKPPASALAER